MKEKSSLYNLCEAARTPTNIRNYWDYVEPNSLRTLFRAFLTPLQSTCFRKFGVIPVHLADYYYVIFRSSPASSLSKIVLTYDGQSVYRVKPKHRIEYIAGLCCVVHYDITSLDVMLTLVVHAMTKPLDYVGKANGSDRWPYDRMIIAEKLKERHENTYPFGTMPL